MADFFTYLTIPKQTPETTPAETAIEIEGDVLVGFYRLIPFGWSCLAHYRILYGLEQLHPANEEAWDTGNGVSDFVPLNWKMPERKIKLTIEGYNESKYYPHTVYLWFRTEDIEYARPIEIVRDIKELLQEVLIGE